MMARAGVRWFGVLRVRRGGVGPVEGGRLETGRRESGRLEAADPVRTPPASAGALPGPAAAGSAGGRLQPPGAAGGGPVGLAVRLGALFGPSVFGVTAAGVALPQVAAELGAGGGAVAWVLTGHALALGIGTAVFGRLADTLGVRVVLLAGAVLLGAGALVAALAPALGVLVGGRLLLAAGSGAMAAGGATLLARAQVRQRSRLLGAYGVVMGVFAASATLAGGVVTAWLSWRLAVVLPVLSLVALPWCLPAAGGGPGGPGGSGRRVDGVGAVLLSGSAGALLVVVQSASLGLGPVVVGVVVAALVASASALAWWVGRRPYGFVPHAVVGRRVLWPVVAAGVGVFGGLFATMFAAPQVLARLHGWSVLGIGAALLPGAVVGAVAARWAGRLGAAGARRVLGVVALAGAGALVAAGAGAGGAWMVVGAASLALAGFALAQIVVTGEVAAHLPAEVRGTGMGLVNLTLFVGGAVGSGLVGALAPVLGLPLVLAVVAVFPLLAALVSVL
ncbi:MFS transporter [Nonomuraea typhae]|uniref:MFS transporter n=1 Tax=Nonomuraea typhae TaxID=2603600 RepID=UPI001CA541B1|nr:MFS transporter [Nonomuraea typhae]